MAETIQASPITPLVDAVNSLQETQKQTNEAIKGLKEAADKKKDESPWGNPMARTGESVMTSRGYSFLKLWGLISGFVSEDDAKVEMGVTQKLRKYYDSFGFKKSLNKSVMMPMFADALVGDASLSAEIKEVTRSGSGAVDLDEVTFLKRRMANLGYTKALSWIDETVGGSLVAPPQFGELIELLRVNEVFMAAGAKVLPMPPQGRITFPKQTSAMTAYHVGESQTITDSTPGTGDLVLSAKKLTILAKIPNELFHFSAIPIEAFVREDMTKVISIAMDKTLFEGAASDTNPKGLINYSQITNYTSVDPGNVSNGYRFQPADPYNMVAKVEEQNAQFKCFVMRPLLWSTLVTRRADAVTAGDAKGPFVFDLIRSIRDPMAQERLKVGELIGYPVFKTTQLSVGHSLGTSSNLTYVIGGDFSDYVVALGGALEFQVSTQGDTPFTLDQTWFKGVMYYDGGPRHEASFVLCDSLYQNT